MASINPQARRLRNGCFRLLAPLLILASLTGLANGQAQPQPQTQPKSQPTPRLPEYQFRERTSSGGEFLKYVIYVPKNLEPGRKYPFAVYLHGLCDECTTQERILKESGLRWWHEYDKDVQQEPTFLLAPVGDTRGWTSPVRRQAVFEIIDSMLQEFPIDQQRIYLMGFSLGGAGVWNYLQARPGFFAAAQPQALSGRDLDPEVLKNTPIWATIGLNDNANRLEQLSAIVAKIRAANGDPQGAATWDTGVNPRLTIFANTDHGGVQEKTQQIPGLREWFYAQSNNGNIPPNVRFIRPLPLDQEFTAPVAALVNATDPDGKIDRVEFSVGDKLMFVANKAPYEYSFADLAPGTYTLSARAVDDGGKSRTAEVTIRVGASAKQ